MRGKKRLEKNISQAVMLLAFCGLIAGGALGETEVDFAGKAYTLAEETEAEFTEAEREIGFQTIEREMEFPAEEINAYFSEECGTPEEETEIYIPEETETYIPEDTETYVPAEEIPSNGLAEEVEGEEDFYIPVWIEETGEKRYISRQQGGGMGFLYEGLFHFDSPYGFYHGTTDLDTELSAFFPDNAKTEIVFNVAKSIREKNAFSENWEEFCGNITKRMKEVLGETAGDLSFEKYTLENGEDVYFYCFNLTDPQGQKWTEAVGYRLSENLKAEFVGISPQSEWYPIQDMVRYMAVDFEDFSQKEDAENFLLWGEHQDVTYMGSDTWDYEEFHNAFALGYRKITGKDWISEAELASLSRISEGEDYEVKWNSPIVESSLRYYLDKMEGPVYASDLEEITSFGLVEWYGIDCIYVNEESYPISFDELYRIYGEERPDDYGRAALLDLQNLPNLSSLLLNLSNVGSLKEIGELTGIKSLRLSEGSWQATATETDISFLGKLEKLESLTIENVFGNVWDWSVLGNCPNLTFLKIETEIPETEMKFPEGVRVVIENW